LFGHRIDMFLADIGREAIYLRLIDRFGVALNRVDHPFIDAATATATIITASRYQHGQGNRY